MALDRDDSDPERPGEDGRPRGDRERSGNPDGSRPPRRLNPPRYSDDLDEDEVREAEAADRVSAWVRIKRLFTIVTKQDRTVARRLFTYLRPNLGRLLLAILLSVFGGLLVVGQLILIEHGLSALTESRSGAVKKSHGPWAKGMELLGFDDKSSAPEVDSTTWSELDRTFTLEDLTLANRSKDDRRDRLLAVVVAVVGLALLAALLKFVQGVLMTSVSRRAIRKIREDAFGNLVRLPMRFHQATHSGRVMARLIKDINRLKTFLVTFSLGITSQLAIFLGALGFAISRTSYAALFGLGFVALAIVPIRYIADRLKHRDKAEEAGSSDLFAIAQEAISGQKVVKAFTAEKHETKRFNAATRSLYKKQMITLRLRAATEPLVDMVAGVGIAAGFWFLGTMVIDEAIRVDVLAAVLLALQKLAGSVRRLGKMNNDFVRGMAAAERVNVLLSASSEDELEDDDAVPFRGVKNHIAFNHASFGYDPDVPILKRIDLEIRRGETIALVGPSGAGKTTLVDLLPRFYDVDDGTITIDGIDLRHFKIKSLRSKIGIVSQETMLFNGNIRENIAYSLKNVTEEAIVAAAIAANAHGFILDKPKGYDTQLGERGGRLSGGERQRIAIARAILKNPPILILDEATSALDAESEALVQGALDRLMTGRTTLIIAHRLATIRRADRIVVLRKGEVAEVGTHDELIRLGGRYATAYQIQMDAMTRGEEEKPLDDYFDMPGNDLPGREGPRPEEGE